MVDVFFFKQKTAYEMRISDWSSDVCSSDLLPARLASNLLGALAVGILVANGIHDDFAKPRRHRSHLRLGPIGQIFSGLKQAFPHLLAREIEIGVVGKDRRNLAEAIARDRARRLEPGNAGKRDFDGISNKLLDLDGRKTTNRKQ